MERISAGVVALLALGLAGCADYGTRNFGTRRGAQDQTRVTELPPLSLPPILTEHRMADGSPAPADQPAPGTLARSAAPPAAAASGRSRRNAAPARGPSSGEASLLDAAGPSAPGDIRSQVDQDAQIGRADRGYSDTLLARPVGPSDAAQGPLIQRQSKSWLDSIF